MDKQQVAFFNGSMAKTIYVYQCKISAPSTYQEDLERSPEMVRMDIWCDNGAMKLDKKGLPDT
jgi:hypothetical protein